MDAKEKIKRLEDELVRASNGFSEDPHTNVKSIEASCHKHGGYTQYSKSIGGSDVFGKRPFLETKTRCPACISNEIEELKESFKATAEKIKNYKIEKLFIESGITKRFEHATFDNYVAVNQNAERNLKICQAYADKWLDRLKNGGGMVMMGLFGTGKNHLATAIAKQIIENHQHSVVITSVMKIARDFKSSWDKDSGYSEDGVIDYFAKPHLLIIDEVGVQFGSNTEKLVLFEIINSRYEDMKPTILISNEPRDKLAEFVGERIIDRMTEGGGCELVFDWESYRSKVRSHET